MSSVRFLYFAGVRELLGRSEEELELPSDVRALGQIPELLVRAHPELAGRLGSVRYAINETFGDPSDRVAPGDVIAVIPPVAGG